jgi:hypothetical protein
MLENRIVFNVFGPHVACSRSLLWDDIYSELGIEKDIFFKIRVCP